MTRKKNPGRRGPGPLMATRQPFYIVASLNGDKIEYLTAFKPETWGTWTKAARFSLKKHAESAADMIERDAIGVSEKLPETEVGPLIRKPKKIEPTWEYETNLGVTVRGTLENFSEGQGSDVTYFFRRETGELDVLSGAPLKKAKRIRNPTGRKKMAKKKRTAKQIAATKKLVALNKKRRKNPGRKKVAKRKTNPKRKRSAKSHLWIVFGCSPKKELYYLTVGGISQPQVQVTSTKSDAILFKTKSQASHMVHVTQKIWASDLIFGIADENSTAAQIRAACNPK